MEGGGFHDDMSEDAKIRHLRLLVMKKCPACQAQVEKHDGSLWYVGACVGGCGWGECEWVRVWVSVSGWVWVSVGVWVWVSVSVS